RPLRRPVETEPHHHDWRDTYQRQCRKEVTERKQTASEKDKTLRDNRDQDTRAAADNVSDQYAANEGLHEIPSERRQARRKSRCRRARRRHDHWRDAEATHNDFPEIEYHRAEQQRNR